MVVQVHSLSCSPHHTPTLADLFGLLSNLGNEFFSGSVVPLCLFIPDFFSLADVITFHWVQRCLYKNIISGYYRLKHFDA